MRSIRIALLLLMSVLAAGAGAQELVDPPPVLFLRGRIELLSRPAVTIVGSRRSTEYGRRSAEALGAQMALRGITVVSGLALGIDGASHRGTLEAGGDTIAVLGACVYNPDDGASCTEGGLPGTCDNQGSCIGLCDAADCTASDQCVQDGSCDDQTGDCISGAN